MITMVAKKRLPVACFEIAPHRPGRHCATSFSEDGRMSVTNRSDPFETANTTMRKGSIFPLWPKHLKLRGHRHPDRDDAHWPVRILTDQAARCRLRLQPGVRLCLG
jgi:hypothetical protein